ncbi:hypothetical protein G3A43_06620 [Paraburkholderia aspalathi]|nr:hypothetical protein [Paraburkholderia aspalathi]MBK3779923.1 hypothetical protein [Paraburkholderia aspalathi]
MRHDDILKYKLIKTNRRLTLDITWQRDDSRYRGPDDGDYFMFVASNGYQVISRSRMDIQTERIWLLGALDNERSGSMVFSSNEKRDRAYKAFMLALDEWCECVRAGNFGPVSAANAAGYRRAQFLGNAVDLEVDPYPRIYRSCVIDDDVHLRRVLACEGAESDWRVGQPQPLTDFARVGSPIPAHQVPSAVAGVTARAPSLSPLTGAA